MQDDLIGTRIGNYKVEAPLGRGGMAQIYRAQDVMLNRPVALKVIKPSLRDDKKYRDRFEREAQSIAALKHPNIVSVYYFGVTKNLYYLAMQFINGEDLAEKLARYRTRKELMPAAEALNILRPIGEALDYAHKQGVIHRDVKPHNIMVDSDGAAYLTDFGLALNMQEGSVGEVFGTPHYMSPEQARNSAAVVPRSDLYSLGIVLYEIFTGTLPFDDPSPGVTALKHLTDAPPPPRERNPRLTAEVEAVILKAIEKEPKDRYASGRQMVNALRKALQAVPTSPPDKKRSASKPPTVNRAQATEKVQRAGKPRGTKGLLLALMLLGVVGVIAFLVLQAMQSTASPDASLDRSTSQQRAVSERLTVVLYYAGDNLWLNNQSTARIAIDRFEFANSRNNTFFQGGRWGRIYAWLEDGACMQALLTAQNEPPLHEVCRRLNALLTVRDDERFWEPPGDFVVRYDEREVVQCSTSAGECRFTIPAD